MTINQLYETLNYVDASRENRLKYAKMVLDDMSLFPKLIEIMFMVNDPISSRAAWVFEYVCNDYIYGLIPYLDVFTKNLKQVYLDSSIRPVAKVCEMLAKEYDSKHNKTIKKNLQAVHKERIIEACFDWMISDQKVAVKAYSMTTLYLLGQEYDWVHPELKQILQHDYANESAGFKARAKQVLKKIKGA
ncbi:adenylosuccinate lyase [Yeosuana sp. MJ-SS3]|uniref:Adenylosuccinate lyase n=1 Tax=Gilvirhabdus luticola TaxID=3079858 RepID=A0ABU3U7M5_9FLAO|nr:adenylosuccinate lyase [Yeosuana sp. MJ-SS3]MDU8886412.1 adenylosuccinate lyase [Yeosuana sp. MJ-SS3]